MNYSLEIEGLVRRKHELEAEIERLRDANKYLGFEVDRHIDECKRLSALNAELLAVLKRVRGDPAAFETLDPPDCDAVDAAIAKAEGK